MSEDNDFESFQDFLRKQAEQRARKKAIGGDDLEQRAQALLQYSYELTSEPLRLEEAIAAAGASADIWLQLERPVDFVRAIWHVGDCLIEASRWDEAIQAYEAAIAQGEENILTRELSSVYFQVSKCYTRVDQEAKAETAAVKAAELGVEAKLKERAPRAYLMASGYARELNRFVESAEYCSKAIELLRDESSPDDLAEAYARRAQNLIDLGIFAEAGDCLDRARNLMQITNMDWLKAGLTFHRARLWGATGMAAEAIPLFDEALQGAKDKSAPGFAAEVLYYRAKAYLEIGEIELARTEFEMLITLTEDGQADLEVPDLENLIAKCRPHPVLFEVAS